MLWYRSRSCPDKLLTLDAPDRTKLRPLASGEIKPLEALTFLGGQLSVGLAILTQLNWYRCVTYPFQSAGFQADRDESTVSPSVPLLSPLWSCTRS